MTGPIPGNLADRGGTISQGDASFSDGDSGGLSFVVGPEERGRVVGNRFFVGLWLGSKQQLDARGRTIDARDQMPHKERKKVWRLAPPVSHRPLVGAGIPGSASPP